MVRATSAQPVSGRPDPVEQEQIAAGVGALLRSLRREQQMSLRDLEARSSINRSTISRIEHGTRRPRASTLGWLAWGLNHDAPEPLKRRLIETAGNSLVAESRWSQRSKARRVEWRLLNGGMPVPMALIAPYAVAMLGAVVPDELERLRQAEAMARCGDLPWPDGLTGSLEALAVADILGAAVPWQLAKIGRNAVRVNDYAAVKARTRRQRRLRALEREAYVARRRLRHAGSGADMAAVARGLTRETRRR